MLCTMSKCFKEDSNYLFIHLCVFVGFSVEVIDEDGTQQLHITEVKAGGLASAKGTYVQIIYNLYSKLLLL